MGRCCSSSRLSIIERKFYCSNFANDLKRASKRPTYFDYFEDTFEVARKIVVLFTKLEHYTLLPRLWPLFWVINCKSNRGVLSTWQDLFQDSAPPHKTTAPQIWSDLLLWQCKNSIQLKLAYNSTNLREKQLGKCLEAYDFEVVEP